MKTKIHKRHLRNLILISALIYLVFWFFDNFSNKPDINKDQAKSEAPQITSQTINAIAIPVDGDSIKIAKGEYIRLLGIDAPEYKQKCLDKNYQEYNCGEIAADFLKKLISGKMINCQYQKKDIYNRYLAFCYLGEMNINYEIVRNGMAIIYNPLDKDVELQNIEKQARLSKVGIWQGPFMEPKEYRKKAKKTKK